MVGLGIDCNSPSVSVKSQVDWVMAASGVEHSLGGHNRCGGECKLGECKHSLLHVHLSCGRAARTSQNGGGGSCFGDHYDSHHKMAEWPRYTDVDYFTGVRCIDDEI